MKKLITLSAAALLLVSAANAQTKDVAKNDTRYEKKENRKTLRKLEGKEVTYQAKQQFITDFNNAPVISSERSDYYDEFTFSQAGVITTAYYDNNAMLIGTSQMKRFSDLPAKAQHEISKTYKNYKQGDVIFFDDNALNDTDFFLYNQQLDDEDSYFVELQKDNKKIVLQVDMKGGVEYLTRLR
ncbi:MAG: hypothetical protein QM687_03465 [Ferruginibacter sp.]